MARTKIPSVRDRLRFRSHVAETQYAQLARKKVEGGRKVVLEDLALFRVEQAFGDMGWLPLITYDACTRPELVRQFYANLHVEGDFNDVERGHELRITSYVKGVDISFDYRQLADLLGVPFDGQLVFCAPGELRFLSLTMRAEMDNQLLRRDRWQMRASFLRPEPRVHCKIIQHNILPQGGHYERVTQLTQYLLYCIDTRQPVCLPYIIMRTMISATLPSHRGNLPYGRMITMILIRLGVDMTDERILEKSFSSLLDWEAICRMGMRDAQVSDEERNAMVRPRTRVEIADAGVAAAAAGAAEVHGEDDDRMYMDVDDIPPPSPTYHTGAGPSSSAGPSYDSSSDMARVLSEIREAQLRVDGRIDELLEAHRQSSIQIAELRDAHRVTDQRVVDMATDLRVTRSHMARISRIFAEEFDRDREDHPSPPPPAP